MSRIFRGECGKLRKYVSEVNASGSWRDLEYGCKQYHTDDGAVFNWWEKSGKITFQGHGKAKVKFEQAFMEIASASGRVTVDNRRIRQKLRDENETLRNLIADVTLENAKLKKRLSAR